MWWWNVCFYKNWSHSVAENVDKLIMMFGTGKSASVNTYQILQSSSSFQCSSLLLFLEGETTAVSALCQLAVCGLHLQDRSYYFFYYYLCVFFFFFPCLFFPPLRKGGKTEYRAHSSYIIPPIFSQLINAWWVVFFLSLFFFLPYRRRESICFWGFCIFY